MSERHHLTLGEENIILRRQALCGCGCGRPIWGQKTIREHLHQLAMGGTDTTDNIAIWLAECSAKKTNGTKATSAGSDAHARAKHRRLTGQNKPRKKRAIPSKPFPKRPAQENAWPRIPKT